MSMPHNHDHEEDCNDDCIRHSPLTEDHLDELKRAFEMVDTNKDGFLDKDELYAMLQATN